MGAFATDKRIGGEFDTPLAFLDTSADYGPYKYGAS